MARPRSRAVADDIWQVIGDGKVVLFERLATRRLYVVLEALVGLE